MLSRWLLSFFDLDGDRHIGFPDVCMVIVGVVFTLKMLGSLPNASPDDPLLWCAFALAIGGYAGAAKVLELRKDRP